MRQSHTLLLFVLFPLQWLLQTSEPEPSQSPSLYFLPGALQTTGQAFWMHEPHQLRGTSGYLWLHHPCCLEDSHSPTIQSGRHREEKGSKSLPSSPTGTYPGQRKQSFPVHVSDRALNISIPRPHPTPKHKHPENQGLGAQCSGAAAPLTRFLLPVGRLTWGLWGVDRVLGRAYWAGYLYRWLHKPDSPSSLRRQCACHSRPGIQRGSEWGRRSRHHRPAVHSREHPGSPGAESL